MASLLHRAANMYLKNQARAMATAATAGGHGGNIKIFPTLENYVTP